jgi:DNA-binding NarL/FixJ family response regulator
MSKARVLIVDDLSMVRVTLKYLICDWKCADGTILDLMKYVKAQNWQIPVYCLAPHSESALVDEALRQGAHGKLGKPFHKGQIQQFRQIFKTNAA